MSEQESSWIVSRTEYGGALTRTRELDEDQARKLYANWAENAKRYHDQEIVLLEVTKTTKAIQRFVNTAEADSKEPK